MKIVKIIVGLVWLLFLCGLISCGAQWHFQRAIKKDPYIFRTDTVTKTEKIPVPAVKAAFNCNDIFERKNVLILSSREYIDGKGKIIHDTVKIELTSIDSANIQAMIKCPDHEIVTIEVPTPYPVTVELSIWKKLKYIGATLLIATIGVLILMLVVFRK